MQFEWKDKYSIGDQHIDSTHQKLFSLANNLVNCVSNEQRIELVMELYAYAHEHFNKEEALMKIKDYPLYKQHIDSHNRMLQALTSKSDEIRFCEWDQSNIIHFMEQWIAHITTEDRELSTYLKTDSLKLSESSI